VVQVMQVMQGVQAVQVCAGAHTGPRPPQSMIWSFDLGLSSCISCRVASH
tara:strand:+ start:117 stop:266 length:150 start_codon:yes stop_codon:yes gene_type:complete